MMIFKHPGAISPLLILATLLSTFSSSSATVSLTISGMKATVSNSLVKISFKTDATVGSCTVNGKNIASTSEKTFYLDWNANGAAALNPTKLVVVENTSSRAHFYYLQDRSGWFKIELHYVLEDGLSGIYSYAKYTNTQSSNLTLGETRTVYRFNPSILLQGYNHVRMGTLPTYSALDKQTKIQDETWKFSNGTYYTKYDYAGYIRDTPYQGVLGNGYGAFVISPSREYHGGGPLSQDLLVHQNSLITNYFVSGHFGVKGLNAPAGWTHVYGPWLIYFPTGGDDQILSNVESRYKTEQSLWPYSWLSDSEYPLKRGAVDGYVWGQKSATVVIHDSSEDFQVQALGYLYTAKTDSNGYFNINNIRPGTYTVSAYPLAGQGSENLATTTVKVTAGTTTRADSLHLVEPENIIWSLGATNRRSSEFKYSNEDRNYVYYTLPPADLTFTIGSSNPANDWYYAQTQKGTWTIQYSDTKDGKGRTLRLGLAATSGGVHLMPKVNGHRLGDLYYTNDQALYRSAIQGGAFSSAVLNITDAQVITGINWIDLQISLGEVAYDAISLARN